MKGAVAVLFLLLVLLIQGCAYVPGIEPTDISSVKDNESTRAEVEAVLGEPIDWQITENYLIHLYVYDAGART